MGPSAIVSMGENWSQCFCVYISSGWQMTHACKWFCTSLQNPTSRLPFGSHTGQHGGPWGQQDRWHAWQECESVSLLGSLPFFSLSVSPLWACSFGWKLIVPLLYSMLPALFSLILTTKLGHVQGSVSHIWGGFFWMLEHVTDYLLLGSSVMFCRVGFRIIFLGCIMRPKCISKSVSSSEEGRSMCFSGYAQSLSFQGKRVSRTILMSVPEIWKGGIIQFDTIIAEAFKLRPNSTSTSSCIASSFQSLWRHWVDQCRSVFLILILLMWQLACGYISGISAYPPRITRYSLLSLSCGNQKRISGNQIYLWCRTIWLA